MKHRTKIIVYRDVETQWRWRMTRAGTIIASSGESFANKHNAVRAAEQLMAATKINTMIEVDETNPLLVKANE